MAMTKKERAEFDAAIYAARLISALRWTAPVEPDMPPPPPGCVGVTEGWMYNAYSRRVYRAWSRESTNGEGKITSHASLQSMPLFSTQSLAYAAMRNDLEKEYGKKLLEIDKIQATLC